MDVFSHKPIDRGELTGSGKSRISFADTPVERARDYLCETADLAGRLAAESVEPIDDVRSTAAYRRFALERVVRRLTLSL